MKRVITILYAVWLISNQVYAQDPNFHIYLCFGQSNMEGVAGIEAQDRVQDARIKVMGAVDCSQWGKTFSLGQWAAYSPPTVRCTTGLSPADYFARTMTANLPSNIKIGIVPVAIGGSSIDLFDKQNYASYVATAPSYMIPTIDLYGGNPYARLVAMAKQAQKDGVIKGILMHQGEANTGQTTWPGKVKAVYDNLIKDLGLNPAETPFLAGEVLRQGWSGYHNTIIATLPSVIPNSYVISAEGLTGIGDSLHFRSSSVRTLGERYAQKMLTLLPKNNNSLPTVSISAPANNSTLCLGSVLTITSNATDSDGTISKVEFYSGSTLLNADNTSPYTYTFTPSSAGIIKLTAKAYDNNSGITTSSEIAVTVNALPTITPYTQANGGTWQQVNAATVCSGGNVNFGPQPIVATGWSWTGPNNYTANTREIYLSNLATSGTYTATYNDGTCSATKDFIITVDCVTGVEDASKHEYSFSLYPNPSTSAFTIESNMSNAKLRLYNANGMLLIDDVIDGNYTIKEELPSGLYELVVIKGSEILTRKIIKK